MRRVESVGARTIWRGDKVTTDLAVHEQSFLAPKELIDHAKVAATELFKIVDKQKLYVDINDKRHLMAEAWQTIVALDNASLVTEWCEPVLDSQGETIAYRAKVNVIKDGEVKASGIMPCGMDEFPTRGQQGYAKHRAAMSSAQTWAGAKAARGKYAWVAVLAGYEPTPENEMARPGVEGDDKGNQPASNTRRNDTGGGDAAPICPIHRVEWFQSPKMKEAGRPFAHPVDGQTEWCARDDSRFGEGVLTKWLNRMKILARNMDEVDRTALATEWKTMTPAQMLETVERLEASPVGQVIIDQEPDMMPDDLSDMGDEHQA